ncbi:hypothetical protein DIPPA_02084 [Diplonema papillatum]|nr:hypothetical protein DIPPA_02084 [Diplonema papillatum]
MFVMLLIGVGHRPAMLQATLGITSMIKCIRQKIWLRTSCIPRETALLALLKIPDKLFVTPHTAWKIEPETAFITFKTVFRMVFMLCKTRSVLRFATQKIESKRALTVFVMR